MYDDAICVLLKINLYFLDHKYFIKYFKDSQILPIKGKATLFCKQYVTSSSQLQIELYCDRSINLQMAMNFLTQAKLNANLN